MNHFAIYLSTNERQPDFICKLYSDLEHDKELSLVQQNSRWLGPSETTVLFKVCPNTKYLLIFKWLLFKNTKVIMSLIPKE
jgi:hypothetical protein